MMALLASSSFPTMFSKIIASVIYGKRFAPIYFTPLQEILNRESDDSQWETIKNHIRFVHVATEQAMKVCFNV